MRRIQTQCHEMCSKMPTKPRDLSLEELTISMLAEWAFSSKLFQHSGPCVLQVPRTITRSAENSRLIPIERSCNKPVRIALVDCALLLIQLQRLCVGARSQCNPVENNASYCE
jgi:hypothetical protein